ncbi:unnamed protein product [Moneuplotes crassus]|uniref:Uncharacterized protein n=1 Tax=Euplotes crassus TaxID=5936 RepID=A0AAD1XWR3_EUPCR|nr:unnamed protein product [Moneuplotes crassus]
MDELIKENNKVPFHQLLEEEKYNTSQLETKRERKKQPRISSQGGFSYYPENLKRLGNNSLSVPRNGGIGRNTSHNYTQRTEDRVLINPRNELPNFNSIMSEDDLILDVKLKRNRKNSRMQSISNTNSAKKLENQNKRNLPILDHKQIKRKSKNISCLSKQQTPSNSLLQKSHKMPKIKQPRINFNSKPKVHIQKSIKPHLPAKKSHLNTPKRARNKIPTIKPPSKLKTTPKARNTRPSRLLIQKSPRRKKIPYKVEPRGASLNAKFLKKYKPSNTSKLMLESERHQASLKRLQQYQKEWGEAKFDRSESHLRRCEACRLRKAKFDQQRLKKRFKKSNGKYLDTSFVQIDEESEEITLRNQRDAYYNGYTLSEQEVMQEEEKDSFHTGENTGLRFTKNSLKRKCKEVCRCIDDYKASPRYSGISPKTRKLKEAEKAKLCFRPILTKKARNIVESNSKELLALNNNSSEEELKVAPPQLEIEDSPELKYVKQKFPILSNTQLQSNRKNLLISKWEEMAKEDEEKQKFEQDKKSKKIHNFT